MTSQNTHTTSRFSVPASAGPLLSLQHVNIPHIVMDSKDCLMSFAGCTDEHCDTDDVEHCRPDQKSP